MLPMVLAVVYSILSSLIVALTVVPLMAFLLLKKTKRRILTNHRDMSYIKVGSFS